MKKVIKSPVFIPALISAIMLLVAIAHLPYGYYQLLRWTVCISGAYIAFLSYQSKKMFWLWPMGIVAVLFNPLLPIYLGKEIWVIIDPIVAIMFVLSGYVLKTG